MIQFYPTCPICENENEKQAANPNNVKVFLQTEDGSAPHEICLKTIQDAEEPMLNFAKQLLGQHPVAQEQARLRAWSVVRKACGKLTLLQYAAKRGEGALQLLFNKDGMRAVEEYAILFKIRTAPQHEKARLIKDLTDYYTIKYIGPIPCKTWMHPFLRELSSMLTEDKSKL